MDRRCARPSCSEFACATLAYDYASMKVWLRYLDDEPHPMTHDLCGTHAAATTPPRGWQITDTRTPARTLLARAG